MGRGRGGLGSGRPGGRGRGGRRRPARRRARGRARAGGASVISRGGCCLVGTPLQEACGIEDTVELALDDSRRAGGESADLRWAARYLADSRTEVFGWCEELGVTWSLLRREEGNSRPRWHLPDGGGPAVIGALLARCRSLGVAIRTSSPVTRILCADGRALGVEVQADGGPCRILADATLVCTGGFTSNRGMLLRHAPALAGMTAFCAAARQRPAAAGTPCCRRQAPRSGPLAISGCIPSEPRIRPIRRAPGAWLCATSAMRSG